MSSELPKPGKIQVAACFLKKEPEKKPVVNKAKAAAALRSTMPAPAKNNQFVAALKAPEEKKSVAELAKMFGKPKDSGPPPVKPKAAGKEETKQAAVDANQTGTNVAALAAKFGGSKIAARPETAKPQAEKNPIAPIGKVSNNPFLKAEREKKEKEE